MNCKKSENNHFQLELTINLKNSLKKSYETLNNYHKNSKNR